MGNRTKSVKTKAKNTQEGWPLIVFVWIGGLGFTGYLFGRVVFLTQPHPLHWAMGLLGAAAGGFVGWLWYRRRGDII